MGNLTTNLSDLVNAAPLNLSIKGLNSTTGAVNALKDTTQDNIGNFWFLIAIVLVFGMLVWVFMGRDKNIVLDFARATLTSSIWCIFISAGFLLGGLVTTIIPILWFSGILIISIGAVHKLKSKGL